jgi:hypothetical protein
MPDHFYAIVRIVSVGAHRPAPQQSPQKTGVAYRTPKSISSFNAGFKSSATKKTNEHRGTPGQPVWQPRFNDRIIRKEEEYNWIWVYFKKILIIGNNWFVFDMHRCYRCTRQGHIGTHGRACLYDPAYMVFGKSSPPYLYKTTTNT